MGCVGETDAGDAAVLAGGSDDDETGGDGVSVDAMGVLDDVAGDTVVGMNVGLRVRVGAGGGDGVVSAGRWLLSE